MCDRECFGDDGLFSAFPDCNEHGRKPIVQEGHGEPCFYCSAPTNSLAGNPSEWPIPLSHPDDPGRVKWHHIGCISERIETSNCVSCDKGHAVICRFCAKEEFAFLRKDNDILLEVVRKISATCSGGSGARYCRTLADEALEKVDGK